MLAISRALLLNPLLLVMDEPTEGLAPVIVAQLEEMLVRLGDEGESVLVIEQNIGVATAVSAQVAIMVNGRVNRIMDSGLLSADRELQQRLLGVGRHGEDDTARKRRTGGTARAGQRRGPSKIYLSNPELPTRWSPPVPVARIEGGRTDSSSAAIRSTAGRAPERVRCARCRSPASRGAGCRHARHQGPGAQIHPRPAQGGRRTHPARRPLHLRQVSASEVPPHQIAAYHPHGPNGVFSNDRGDSVAAMAEAFEAWIKRRAASPASSRPAAPAARRWRARHAHLPVGVPRS